MSGDHCNTSHWSGPTSPAAQRRRWDGDFYDVAMYFIREARGAKPATVIAGSSRYYAVSIDRTVSLLEESSFIEVQRLEGAGVVSQPVLVARRR